MKNTLMLVAICLLLGACKTNVQTDVVIYTNDFEGNNVSGVANGVTSLYNGTKVLGQYNNGGFTLNVNNLPNHNLVTITFDLYIHDNWRGQLLPDGPDIWQMLVNGSIYINTTFSNLPCIPGNICPPQAYPADYPNSYNNPRTGAYRTDLAGVCSQVSVIGGTTQYKIKKTIKHSDKTLVLQCLDRLNQSNNATPKCDKSWSVDNVTVKAIAL